MTCCEFTVRCADGRLLNYVDPGEVWATVEAADRSADMWDRDCECGGPHAVMVRHHTTWEPLDE